MIFALAWVVQVFAPNTEGKKQMQMYATYYHNRFEQRLTSTGEVFSQRKYTAAHKTLPLNTLVRVTNTLNKRSVIVKINDRCPNPNVIDMSLISAKRILLHNTGVSKVLVEVLNDSCKWIWEGQDAIFQIFDRSEFNDTYLLHSNITGLKFEQTFLFPYYIKVSDLNNEESAKRIISQFSENLKSKSLIKKQKEHYFIYIGGFFSKEKANDIVNVLKSNYLLTSKVVKNEILNW
ncbi:MAG: septal ring lytic transglycosylase RlpA family protein [Bacteroidales bacterium]|jgi:rare lipoprotein A|nr:septal ring lytic transglycosylase RlpA family protein [Bacteroidales bacterium]